MYEGIESQTVPDAVGLNTALERMHTERLYNEEQSLNEVRFRNVDGSTTLYLFDYPVKYTNSRGNVNDISLEIKDTNTTNIPYYTAAADAVTYFSRNVTDGITLSNDDVSVTLTPILPTLSTSPTEKSTLNADTTVASVINRIDDKTVAYTYDSKTSIEYSLTYTGFKEDIVVNEYTGRTEYDFTLDTNGLYLRETKGSFNLCDEKGNAKAFLGDIIIFTADERNNTFGSMTAKTITEGEKYLLTIHVDEDYLSDPKTKYPIRIDPTIEINYDSYGGSAIEDITINSIDTLSGSGTTLGVGKYGDDQSVSRALMKFPGLDLSIVQSEAYIQRAAVEIRDLMCQHEQLAVYCHTFTGNVWSESNASWSNVSPDSYVSSASVKYVSYADGVEQPIAHRYSFNITGAVMGWKTGYYSQSKGIIFKAGADDEANTTHNYKTFASYNRSSNKPSFSMTYIESDGESPYPETISDNTYYINNELSGKYLWTYSTPYTTSGLISNLGNTIRWQVININGGSYIRSAYDTTKYLGVSSNLSSVQLYTVNDTSIPGECIWTIEHARNGGCLISFSDEAYGSLYLKASQNSLELSNTLNSPATEHYKSCTWRVADTNYLNTADSSSQRSELLSFAVNNCSIHVGQPIDPKITYTASNAIWTSASNFSYSFSDNYITIPKHGTIIGQLASVSTVTATHKVTGLTNTFTLTVNDGILTAQCMQGENINVPYSLANNSTASKNDAIWTVSDESVAAISSNGNISAISSGYTLVYATNSENVLTFVCELQVNDPLSDILSAFTENEIQYLYCPYTQLNAWTSDYQPYQFAYKVAILSALRPYYRIIDTNQHPDENSICEILIDEVGISAPSADIAAALFYECYMGYHGLYNSEYLTAQRIQYFTYLKEIVTVCAFRLAAQLDTVNTNSNYAGLDELKTDLSHAWTNNKESNNIMLGSTYGGKCYAVEAQKRGYKYFYSWNYDEFKFKYGYNFVLDVNYKFLDKSIQQNCTFYFSHDPLEYTGGSLFREYEYLKAYYKSLGKTVSLVEFGDIWRLAVN